MPKTFDEAQEEVQERRKERDERTSPSDEEFSQRTPYSFGGESLSDIVDSLPSIAKVTPERLRPEGRTALEDDRLLRQQRILTILEEEFGVNLQEITNSVDDLNSIDLSGLSQIELLRVIAQGISLMSRIMNSRLATQVSQLEAQFSIAEAVEPSTLITVSGRNVIDSADTPVPVVPDADKVSVPTRTLFVLADPDNNSPIAFGDDKIDPDDGFVLRPGESMTISVDMREDQFYMSTNTEGNAVRLIGVF